MLLKHKSGFQIKKHNEFKPSDMEMSLGFLLSIKVCYNLFINMKKGFTLIELLVVVSIISFLSSITLSSFQDVRTRSKIAAVAMSLHEVKSALQLYSTDKGGFPVALNDLIVKGSISSIDPALSYYPLFNDGNLCDTEPCFSYILLAWQNPDPNTKKRLAVCIE